MAAYIPLSDLKSKGLDDSDGVQTPLVIVLEHVKGHNESILVDGAEDLR